MAEMIKPEELEGSCARFMSEYMVDIQKATRADITEVGEQCAKELKKTSPYRKKKGAKHYRNGWVSVVEEVGDGSVTATIHNKLKPGLTHLLEHGHGGPHPAAAQPHIEAAYINASNNLKERMS